MKFKSYILHGLWLPMVEGKQEMEAKSGMQTCSLAQIERLNYSFYN